MNAPYFACAESQFQPSPSPCIAAAILAQPASAFRDRDCADFATQRQAQSFYKKHHPNRDPHRLDADRDGLACEDLP